MNDVVIAKPLVCCGIDACVKIEVGFYMARGEKARYLACLCPGSDQTLEFCPAVEISKIPSNRRILLF